MSFFRLFIVSILLNSLLLSSESRKFNSYADLLRIIVVEEYDKNELKSVLRSCYNSYPDFLYDLCNTRLNNNNDTILHVTCNKGDLATSLLLLQYGANPKATNNLGQKPFDVVPSNNKILKNAMDQAELERTAIKVLCTLCTDSSQQL